MVDHRPDVVSPIPEMPPIGASCGQRAALNAARAYDTEAPAARCGPPAGPRGRRVPRHGAVPEPPQAAPSARSGPPGILPVMSKLPFDDPGHRLRRREALAALGGVGLAGVLGAAGPRRGTGTAEAAASCVLTPEVTEGPYWIDNSLTRRTITEGRPGLPLEIVFTVQNATTCEPIGGADVEIWHCDAGGRYSGYESLSQGGGPSASAAQGGGHRSPTSGTHYLRGHQRSDAKGRAEFLTVFPGWYRGRTPHIHVKVHVGGRVIHSGQVFFNEHTTAAVYRQSPYRTHGQPDTEHAADSIFKQAGGSSAVLHLARRSASRKGYRGRITLGVATG